MAGPFTYFIVDNKTRKILALCIVAAVVAFVLGIVIGYVSGHRQALDGNRSSKNTKAEVIGPLCRESFSYSNITRLYIKRYEETNSGKFSCLKRGSDCWNYELPRHYIAYHLNEKTILLDGKLDEEAWKEVPWSETFLDLRSKAYPKPHYVTKFKIRWDDVNLYIGAYLQENDIWAKFSAHDSKIWTENGFDLLLDVDGTLFNYKQVELNARGVAMDLLMYKSYWDAAGKKVHDMKWDSGVERAIYTEGTVNNPTDRDKYWSLEMMLPFTKLAENSRRVQPYPYDDEVWFSQFARPQQYLRVDKNGEYEKDPNATSLWWVWQPCYTLHGHLQDRWGHVQFKRTFTDRKFTFERWHIYKALFDSLNAMKQYRALNGFYTDDIRELDIPPYLMTRTCVEIPKLDVSNSKDNANFNITVLSLFLSNTTAFIRSDRYVTFL